MTFLPIIERELRVRARSRATYWTRFAVVLTGMLVCLPQWMWSGPLGTFDTLGRSFLNGLVSAAFVLSCGACLLTADVISLERREGTLGLLLLTRVKTFDVLLGKLGSAGLTSLCALVACLPMLMISVLTGGVTGGEVFRKGLVLPETLFLALAVGLWASAGGRERLKTSRTALLLLAGVVLAPSLLDLPSAHIWPPGPTLALCSPLGALSSAGDASYKASPKQFLASLILVQAVGWALMVSAGFRLRSSWREERGEITAATTTTAEEPEIKTACPVRRPLEDANPIVWLLQRQRGMQVLLWAGALVGLSHVGAVPVLIRFMRPSSYPSVVWSLSLASAALEGALFAWAASRFFVEARRTGELELLLTTPLGARELVSAQWAVLKHRLRWPMLVLFIPWLLGVFTGLLAHPQSQWLLGAVFGLIGCGEIFLGVGALCWLGLWFGLKAGGQGRAIVWTISLAKGLPFVITILCWYPLAALSGAVFGWRSSFYSITMWLPQVVTLALYLGLIRLARRRLLGELAGAEPMKFDLRQSISSVAHDASGAFRKARHWTPS
jgi:hypothetical protein